MIWIIPVVLTWLVFLPIHRKTRLQQTYRYDGGWLAFPWILTVISLIFLVVTFVRTLGKSSDLDAFYETNAEYFVLTINETKDATVLIQNPSPSDLGIKVENLQHSTVNAERIVELRQEATSFNKDVVYYHRLKDLNWLLWPAVNQPRTAKLLPVDTLFERYAR